MENRFDFLDKEEKIYKNWEKNGYFKPQIDKSKKPFVISMPPPNVTAKLHIGHALDNTLQDVFVRYHRLKGEPTLWIPGTDSSTLYDRTQDSGKCNACDFPWNSGAPLCI